MAGGNPKLWEMITRLEALIGGTNNREELVDLVIQIQRVNTELTLAKDVLNEKVEKLEVDYAANHKMAQTNMEVIRKEKEDLRGEVLLLCRVLQGTINPIMMKVPKPKAYNGLMNAKELENFLWDIENYFKEAKVMDSEKALKMGGRIRVDFDQAMTIQCLDIALVPKMLRELLQRTKIQQGHAHARHMRRLPFCYRLCPDSLALQGTINPIMMKVPKPKAYNGLRNAKELENFL
ncbi:hypothetical protein RDI58_014934 [Solanum bulbocastanum]|uniref:Uncharacterized protein n=1 Tax=Solanum bulbocastanum TaxID=147425 RepID=A0AAN8TGU5_SOLBU